MDKRSTKRRRLPLLTVPAVLVVVQPSFASSPDVPIIILPVETVAEASPRSLRVKLNSERVLDVSCQGSTRQLEGPESSPESVGISIVAPQSNMPELQKQERGLAVAAKGDSVVMPWPQTMSLSPGFYAEKLDCIIFSGDFEEPSQLNANVYFEVNKQGTRPITVEEYSAAVDAKQPLFLLPDGSLGRQGFLIPLESGALEALP